MRRGVVREATETKSQPKPVPGMWSEKQKNSHMVDVSQKVFLSFSPSASYSEGWGGQVLWFFTFYKWNIDSFIQSAGQQTHISHFFVHDWALRIQETNLILAFKIVHSWTVFFIVSWKTKSWDFLLKMQSKFRQMSKKVKTFKSFPIINFVKSFPLSWTDHDLYIEIWVFLFVISTHKATWNLLRNAWCHHL